MCYAILTAKFGPGEEPQTIRTETREDCDAKVAALKDNPHCVSVSVYLRGRTYRRVSTWDDGLGGEA